MQVIFASGNAGKVTEMQQLLMPVGIELKSLKDFGLGGAEETATTFVENALIKCRAAAQKTKLPAIADDSGLVVPALDGAPGVYSARYAGANASDAENNKKLLAQMAQFDDRGAAFFCCMTYMQSPTDPTPIIAFGQWHGEILRQPRGAGGFGARRHRGRIACQYKKSTESPRHGLPRTVVAVARPQLTPCWTARGYIFITLGV
jgi:XTP/dITP diphosphohydrolase